jgi:hypothetical protein
VLDDPVTEQGPILHQTKHPNSLLKRCVLAPFPLRKRAEKAINPEIGMNHIAENGHRKWAYGIPVPVMVTVVTALMFVGIQARPVMAAKRLNLGDLFEGPPRLRSVHSLKVPLPRPRPSEASTAEPESPSAAKPSACRTALSQEIAIAPSIPDIQGAGGCGGTDLVRLEAVVLPDKHRVTVTPAATLRCSMATAIADWVRTDIVPVTAKLGSEISRLDNFDSYECRGFNRIPGAHLSEHGRANALDVRAFKLADGRSISLTDRRVPRDVRESVLHSVCARFMTVLGPASDWYHEDHIHLDLMERRNNYRICQWDVLDPLPQIAPLMPAERPEEAPPREVAAKSDGDKSGRERPDATKQEAPDAQAEDKPAAESSPAKKSASTKKRR